jgi:hypothetical protein
MKCFDKSADAYAAGYALPWYSVERTTRAWRYKDNIFTTPVDAPVERVSLAGQVLAALHMDNYEPSTLPRDSR